MLLSIVVNLLSSVNGNPVRIASRIAADTIMAAASSSHDSISLRGTASFDVFCV